MRAAALNVADSGRSHNRRGRAGAVVRAVAGVFFGLCGGFQNAGFQTGRSLHFDAGSDGVEGCFRLAVEFGAGGTRFEMFQHFAANLCGGIVIEQQFDSVFKIGAFHGG